MLSAFEPTPFADSTSGVAEMEPSTPLGITSHGRNERVHHGLLNAVSDVLQHSDAFTNFSVISSGRLEPQSWHVHVMPNVPRNSVTSSHAGSSNALARKIEEHREEIKPGNMDLGKITRVHQSPHTGGIAVNQSGRWQERFQDLCKFRQVYGHCCVPNHWPQNPPLSQWVKRQRCQYKRKKEGQHSTMTEDRNKALELS
jgi:hypothetical protein